MTIPFNISAKFEIMGYEKLKLFSSPNFSSFFERLIYYIGISRSLANQDLKKDLIRKS